MEIRKRLITKAWWGKLIGAFFGFLIAGPLGALLGILVGNFFDRGLVEHFSKPFWFYHAEKNSIVKQTFFESLFLVLGHLAKSEGRVSETAINAAREVMYQMQLNAENLQQAQDLFAQGKQKTFNLQQTTETLYQAIGQKPALIRLFLQTQYQYIQKTGITEKKLWSMNQLLTGFHLAPVYEQQPIRNDFNWTYHTYRQGESQSSSSRQRQSSYSGASQGYGNAVYNAYQLLGLTPLASQSEVKRAYRRLISTHHPDKLIARKASEQAIKLANEKTQQIRSAYESICATKGW